MIRPPKPLDENGQGVPYAQFGYAAHIALVEVDPGHWAPSGCAGDAGRGA